MLDPVAGYGVHHHSSDPFAPALLALAFGGLDVEADDHRLLERASFVYDALYAWCVRETETTSA